jgi:acetyl-CoA acetyltransferase
VIAQPIVVVGAAETTKLGRIPDMSSLDLHVDAARNALADAGLRKDAIDGIASTGYDPVFVAAALGLQPDYLDSTMVGGCSAFLHVRHAVAALRAGLCTTVLITHGESGRSQVSPMPFSFDLSADDGQFELPYGPAGPPGTFPMGVLRYMKDFGLTHEQLASVAVAQRSWAARNPRAMMQAPITIDDVLASPLVAYPLHRLECCLVADGGGALILTTAERAADLELQAEPVTVLGSAESIEVPMISMMEDLTTSRAFRRSGGRAFAEAGISRGDVDHLMIYDAFAFLPIYGLEDLGFVGRGEAGAFIAAGNTAPGGRLPMNTNGGGLSYAHTGMYGMFALQESVRQVRGTAPAQIPGVEIAVSHGVGGFFRAAATVVFGKH